VNRRARDSSALCVAADEIAEAGAVDDRTKAVLRNMRRSILHRVPHSMRLGIPHIPDTDRSSIAVRN
jgi:hypothetical protein